MNREGMFRRLRGALGNAVVWGGAWAASAMVVFGVLWAAGIITQANIGDAVFIGARFGVVGAIASVAFSSVVRLLYRGRRLSDISWQRFGLGGAVVGGVFVTGLIVVNKLVTGEPMVPIENLLTNGGLAAAFGGIAAAGSLKLAQRAERLPAAGIPDPVDGVDELDLLAAGESPASPIVQRSRSSSRFK